MNEYTDLLNYFLPPTAKVLDLQQPQKQAAILLADINGDQVEELIVAYRFQEKNYILILKNVNGQWQPMAHIIGRGYGITDLLAAPITNRGVNTLIVGWQQGSMLSELNLLQWTNDGFKRLPTNDIAYSKLEVEDMPGTNGQDGLAEIAIWTHDTGEAYKVDVYRFDGNGLVPAKDVYPYYFKKVEAYYKHRLQKNDYPFYWYYLADAQNKAGDFEQALLSIEKAMSFNSPYPSKETLEALKNEILHALRRTPSTMIVVDEKRGDVNGDGFMDTVYITAEKDKDSPFWKNITLVILYGKTNVHERLPLKENMGYHPTIFLGDFTGDQLDDILIVIDTGGSGATVNGYIFSFVEGTMQQVFDADQFDAQHHYEVAYQDHYKAIVKSAVPHKKYTLDLGYKGKEYLSEIYNEDGTLKKPIEGWVDPPSGLYPIDLARTGVYELNIVQQIAGRYHADGLGYVESMLKWDGHKFVVDRQSVSIFGEDLS
ncbi:hypothetical protein FITA111629_12490 [Filibacter tadaridae]|uniref:FG-GAP repeat protein n=1 Tax=Filibacter tadaridae TaxID=2483811 RepID=A0A3P5X4W3_9BACL|nr:hypothetical protein [Filibacter tadaridae]VDC25516.1 FG-GAP repeat protein [Filibacter tadaridae]